jgi:hypothetical protein
VSSNEIQTVIQKQKEEEAKLSHYNQSLPEAHHYNPVYVTSIGRRIQKSTPKTI